jgi:DNA-binding transcriptional MerR regulator
MAKKVWTLTQVARILNVSPHRLIYLCEKDVVVPDYGDAAGRGSSRGFSGENILEFAVALRLRNLTIPVASVGAIIYVLHAFAKVMEGRVEGFSIIKDFCRKGSPELRIIISDGERLYFALGESNKRPKLFGGVDFKRILSERPRVTFKELPSAAKGSGEWGSQEGTKHARIEVNVTAIAKELSLGE